MMAPAEEWDRDWTAPAKLNLFLHVIGRREDGYHLMQTVFRLIDCCDRLRFAPRMDGSVRLTRKLTGIAEDRELSVRAARLLQAETGTTNGVDISLVKEIQIGRAHV